MVWKCKTFCIEKESLIREFAEEHKTEILEIQKENRRLESILLQDHTQRVDELEDKVEKLQQELIQRENKIQTQYTPTKQYCRSWVIR